MYEGVDAICDAIRSGFIALIAQQMRAANNSTDESQCLDQATKLVRAALEKITPAPVRTSEHVHVELEPFEPRVG